MCIPVFNTLYYVNYDSNKTTYVTLTFFEKKNGILQNTIFFSILIFGNALQ